MFLSSFLVLTIIVNEVLYLIRDSLPYDGIEKLGNIPIKISSRIGIATLNETKSLLFIKELNDHFQDHGIY